jgi:hypothetical protein
MNLDDESHLSAYLDDELAPADRRAVEWSIEESSRLADRLRSIAQTRDAVASLGRPPIPRDLAPVLEARIALNRRKSWRRPVARFAVAASGFAGVFAIAASLLLAIIRLNPALHDSPEPIQVAVQDQPAPEVRHHPIPRPDPGSIPPRSAPRAVPPAWEVQQVPPVRIVQAPAPGPVSPEPDDRRVIGEILGRSHVRRIVIVTDVIDAPEQVRNLIAQNGRETPEFGRISIQEEIVLDLDHAEPAVVFAVPIDERGRRSFIDRLEKSFPDLVEEGQSRPELVAGLTKVGQVAILHGLKAAPLGDPPSDLSEFIATREKQGEPFLLEANHPQPGPARPSRAAEQPIGLAGAAGLVGPDSEEADAGFVGPPDLERKAPPRPGERVTLLVWVTRPGRR